MNEVCLLGEVTDRPFRPGGGQRTVVKLRVRKKSGGFDRFEFDAFGQPGEFGLGLYTGDLIAVTGHLEDRSFMENGEQVGELRVVADFIELVMRASQRMPNPSPPKSG